MLKKIDDIGLPREEIGVEPAVCIFTRAPSAKKNEGKKENCHLENLQTINILPRDQWHENSETQKKAQGNINFNTIRD